MHDLAFGGHIFCAMADRALFWRERRALLVADLHLEKASWFARGGQMLPPFDSIATMTRLEALAERTGAREIWALGDSFHDGEGPVRLAAGARERLAALARRVRIVWIAGNHDARADLPGERSEEALLDGIMLRHEAEPDEARPEISGHFHPKLRVRTALRAVARPCFLASTDKLILPAFGALTGGLDVLSDPIRKAIGNRAEALVATERRLLRFAVEHGRPDDRGRSGAAARRMAGATRETV